MENSIVMPHPLQLIKPNDNRTELLLVKETVSKLSEITGDVVVVSIVGPQVPFLSNFCSI